MDMMLCHRVVLIILKEHGACIFKESKSLEGMPGWTIRFHQFLPGWPFSQPQKVTLIYIYIYIYSLGPAQVVCRLTKTEMKQN